MILNAKNIRKIQVDLFILHFFCRPAFNVLLRDASFPPADFQVVSGMLEAKWDRIPAGSNVTHAVVLSPVRPGYFNFSSADITYKTSEKASDVQVGFALQNIIKGLNVGNSPDT